MTRLAFTNPIALNLSLQASSYLSHRPLRNLRAPRPTAAKDGQCRNCRMAANANDKDDESQRKKWREEVKMLFDSNMSDQGRQFILQDLFKQGPTIAREIIGEACEKAGIPGVSNVLEQVEKDLIPDVVQNTNEYVQIAMNEGPKAVQGFTKAVTSGNVATPNANLNLNDIQREAKNTFTGSSEGYESPDYEVLSRKDGYEIRKYNGYLVAETTMKRYKEGARELKAVKENGQAFNTLASYLFGKNQKNEAMSMTVPVRTDTSDAESKMSFVIPRKYATLDDVPKPNTQDVQVRELPSYTVAVSKFSGFATEGAVERQYKELCEKLKRDGINIDSFPERYSVLQYSGPNVLPNVRKNEICIPVLFQPAAAAAAPSIA